MNDDAAFPRGKTSDAKGLTKREYFAVRAMQSFLSTFKYEAGADKPQIAKAAVQMADALIAELAK
jgi:hypothetical protein